MKSIAILVFLSLLFAGCATAKKTYTADGQEGYVIDCSGRDLSWGMCYEKAGEICGERGYIVLQKMDDQGAAVAGSQFGVFGGTIIHRNLIIKCKDKN